MSTPAALYYPHTSITDKNLIKSSLLLWDQVEYIVPKSDWKHPQFSENIYNEALDIISKPHLPKESEKKQVHERVKGLVEKGIPNWLRLESNRSKKDQETYPVYPEKLSDETWNLLQSEALTEFDWRDNDYHMHPYFGLMTMSLLAESCAGKTRKIITDRADAYAMIQKFETAEMGGEYLTAADAEKTTSAYENLVNISIKVINTDDIPIENIIAMRKREAKSSGHDYRNLRIKYLEAIENCVDDICDKANSESDVEEIKRKFELDIKDDLAILKDELKSTNTSLFLSKEVLVAASAFVTAVFNPFKVIESAAAIGVVGVGAVLKNINDNRKAKKKHLKEHPMSWLYLSTKKSKLI